MKLNDFKFIANKNFSKSIEAYNNPFLKELKNLIKKNIGVFEFTNQFFYINSDNIQSPEDAKETLKIEKEFFEYEFNQNPQLPNFDSNLADKVMNRLITLFSLDNSEYRQIRDQYIELIVLYWKVTPGGTSKIYHEPIIFYQRRKCFYNKEYCNTRCDVVHIDYKRNIFEMYECKTTMKAFLKDLGSNINLVSSPKHKKNVTTSIRKKNYLSAFYDLVQNRVNNLSSKEVAYVTLAPQEDLRIKGEIVTKISSVSIITREKLNMAFDNL